MGNWAFEIDRADNYIIDLTALLTDEGFRIWCLPSMDDEFPPLYLFSSAYLNNTANENVYVQARQLVKFIDGLSYLLFENKQNAPKINFTNIIDRNTLRIANLPRHNASPATVDFTGYVPALEEDESALSRILKLIPKHKFIRTLLETLESPAEAYDLIEAFLASRSSSLAQLDFPERSADLLSDVVIKVLSTFYRIDLTPYIVKDRQADWDYDSMYD